MGCCRRIGGLAFRSRRHSSTSGNDMVCRSWRAALYALSVVIANPSTTRLRRAVPLPTSFAGRDVQDARQSLQVNVRNVGKRTLAPYWSHIVMAPAKSGTSLVISQQRVYCVGLWPLRLRFHGTFVGVHAQLFTAIEAPHNNPPNRLAASESIAAHEFEIATTCDLENARSNQSVVAAPILREVCHKPQGDIHASHAQSRRRQVDVACYRIGRAALRDPKLFTRFPIRLGLTEKQQCSRNSSSRHKR